MTRETVTLVRDVFCVNYDGQTAERKTEVIDVVVEWPDDKPPEFSSCTGYSDWRIAKRIPKPTTEQVKF